MRYAILGDIHSNLEALQAVLADLDGRGGATELWCLGDVVGYGPEPRRCIELLRQRPHCCVAGNHDWAAVGKIDTWDFNEAAAAAAEWTAAQLQPPDIEYLKALPLQLQRGSFTLVHGSPRQPLWEYIMSLAVARDNFSHFETAHCLVGHSHAPVAYRYYVHTRVCDHIELPAKLSLKEEGVRLILNPGGVGQPRDGDPRASYAILDDEDATVHHYRVPYDVAATQHKMREAALPERLAMRLAYGF